MMQGSREMGREGFKGTADEVELEKEHLSLSECGAGRKDR